MGKPEEVGEVVEEQVAAGLPEVGEEVDADMLGLAPRFTRFAAIVNPEKIEASPVAVIGCGGIGSWVAMGLGCLGVKLHVFDPDITQHHNYGGQPLPLAGTHKVVQVRKMLKGLANITAYPDYFHPELLRTTKEYPRIWVSGLDSIEARREVWDFIAYTEKASKVGRSNANKFPLWYVDGRMGGTSSHVITVNLTDEAARKKYERTLAPKGGFVDDPCAMRSTVFAGMGCAAQIVAKVAEIIQRPEKVKSEQMNSEWFSGQNFIGWTK